MPTTRAARKPKTVKAGGAQKLDMRAVAKRAAVSVATVSRAINRVPTVDPKLSKRVWHAVEELGYVLNTQARSLVSGHSNLIGVIISDITNPFFPELIQGFETSAVALGYETLIGSTNYDTSTMELCVARMLQRNVEGVAIMTFGIEKPLLSRFARQGIPMVFIDVAPKSDKAVAITVDYEKGITEAVQHLAVLGHRRIAFISGPPTLQSAATREAAFRCAARQIGLSLPSEYVLSGDHTMEKGQELTELLLSLSKPPTAIMCSNDMTAIGSMHAISSAGLSIPKDISLIGFDDVRMAQFTVPPLTTIRMSGQEISLAAVAALKGMIDECETPLTVIPTSLIVRRSTGIPAGAMKDLRRRGKAFPNIGR